MKKLLIMTGVAAFALGAFAELPKWPNGSGFDSNEAGKAFDASGDNYWGTLPSDLEATVTAYAGSGETAYATRPAYFVDNNVSQSNFLAIESASTSNPLVRYINESSTAGKDIGNGLYLDTLVQFTVSTETMGVDNSKIGENERPAKLAIWAQTSDENPAPTNIVVQAGYITASGVESHNYVMTAPADFDFTAWHRLTVKAIGDIGGGYVGFVVFVDNNPLVRADDDIGTIDLNSAGSQFSGAVLPSLVSTGDTKTTLQAVSFSGNGKIDDVSFTDVAPDFAASDVVFTLTVGEGIAAVKLNDNDPEAVEAGDVLKISLADGIGSTVTVTVTYADGYRDAVLTGENDGDIEGLEFTVSGYSPAATISAVRDMFTITADGKTVGYATLADAIKDAAKGTIVMADNYTIPGSTFIDVTSDVVLDLAGKSLTGPENDALFVLEQGVSLTIVNSAVNDASLFVNYSEEDYVPAERYVVTNNNGGDVIIGNKDGGFVVVNGNITAAVSANASENTIYKGKFAVASNSNSTGNACDLSPESIAKGSTLLGEPVEGYWVVDVGGDEPVEDTPVAVPTAVTDLVYDGTVKTGVEAGIGYTLTGNTGTNAGEYTATATLVEGYKWNDETKEPKSINWTIAKKSVEATITLTTDSATYDAEKKTVGDYTGAVTVSFGDDALSEGTDYTVTGLDATVEAAGEFTVTVEPVEGGNYSFESASAKLTVTAVQPPEPVKVEPGATAESDTETAAKAVEFVAPAAVTEAGVDAEKYAALFEQKTSYNKTSGKWETTYELTAKAVDDLTDEVDADVKEITPTAAEASFTGTPGIYYHTVSGTSVNDLTGDNNWVMADDKGSVTLTLPKAGGKSGFYKIEASATTK